MAGFIVDSAPRQRLLMAVVAVGAFMANLDTCIVNVSLPTIAHEYGVSPSAVSLVVLSYLLCEVSFLLFFGKLGQIWGVSRIFLLGFAVFTVGSLLCGLSPGLVQLVGWRALQGIGGSMIFAVMFVFPGLYLPAGRRAAATGVLTMAAALGIAAGPPLGGLLTSTLGWHWIFFVNLPIGVAALAAGIAWLPRRQPACADRRLDVPGAALSFLAFLLLLLSLNMGREWGWFSATTLGTLGVGAGCALAFLLREWRARHPLLDLHLFAHRNFSLATTAFLVAMATTGGVLFLFPFYLQVQRGLTPLVCGAVLMVIAGGQLMGPWAGGLADRYGARAVCSAGLTISALAFVLFCLLNDRSAIWFIVLSLSLFGLSQGLNKAPNINLAMEDVPELHKPLAGSVISVARSLGLALGVVTFETVFSEVIPHRVSIENVSVQAARVDPGLLQHGFSVAFILGIALSLLALYLTLRLRAPRAPETVEQLGAAVHSAPR
jgi:DHA2 family metal-tetracycline-proton antiporter-like MFS transporter